MRLDSGNARGDMIEPWPEGDDRQRGCLWARLLVAALVALACLPLFAAEREFYFDRLDDERGLLQNSIHAVYQDRTGYLWVGTQGGLHQFDGYRFKRYEYDADNPRSLPDSVVRAISEDAEGRLWIGTLARGVARLDPASGVFEPFALPADAVMRNDRESIAALAFDPARGLWIGSRNGLDLLDATGTRQQIELAAGLETGAVRALLLAADGDLWVPARRPAARAAGFAARRTHRSRCSR